MNTGVCLRMVQGVVQVNGILTAGRPGGSGPGANLGAGGFERGGGRGGVAGRGDRFAPHGLGCVEFWAKGFWAGHGVEGEPRTGWGLRPSCNTRLKLKIFVKRARGVSGVD